MCGHHPEPTQLATVLRESANNIDVSVPLLAHLPVTTVTTAAVRLVGFTATGSRLTLLSAAAHRLLRAAASCPTARSTCPRYHRIFNYRLITQRRATLYSTVVRVASRVGGGNIYISMDVTCVCVFFPSILDIKFVGRTSRGHTGGRSHRIFNPPSFCGACLDFWREKDSAIPFPRRP